jgi:CubicO group peptidase (beta-lactamase class C family)
MIRPTPKTAAVIEEGMAARLHIGAQVFASIHGEPVVDAAFGLAREGVAMTPDHLMLWLSSCKPIAAVAIGKLWEQSRLDLDDRVAVHIPEFAAGGKENITIRQILTHTCGFRSAALNWTPESWEQVIAKICTTRLEPGWIPGRKAGYHASGSWYILGELVRRIDGRAFEQYAREEILLPVGMTDSWLAMPLEKYREYGIRFGLMHDTSGESPNAYFFTDTDVGVVHCRPGASGHGPIRELGFFYEMILGKGQRQGRRILSPQTVEALTARHRCGLFDHTFKHTMDWSLGFIPDNNMYGVETMPYPYGKYSSPRTVGHSGHQSSTGFCDPEHGLAVGIVFNGCPGDERHAARIRAATAAIYEDLGLT